MIVYAILVIRKYSVNQKLEINNNKRDKKMMPKNAKEAVLWLFEELYDSGEYLKKDCVFDCMKCLCEEFRLFDELEKLNEKLAPDDIMIVNKYEVKNMLEDEFSQLILKIEHHL